MLCIKLAAAVGHGRPNTRVADIDTQLRLYLICRGISHTLLEVGVGKAPIAAISSTSLPTQIQALMVTRYVTLFAFTAGSMGTRITVDVRVLDYVLVLLWAVVVLHILIVHLLLSSIGVPAVCPIVVTAG